MSRPSRRQLQSEQTRRAILDAALTRFLRDGYGATSVGAIADEAGVAVPTVYASVGPKPALLRRLLDGIDEKADVPAQVARLLTSDDPRDVLARQIAITRSIAERCGDELTALASAAGVDPEMAAVHRAGLERHRAGAAATVARLGELGALRPAADVAVGVLATLTATGVWRGLTVDHGWRFDDAEQWIRACLERELLGEPAPHCS